MSFKIYCFLLLFLHLKSTCASFLLGGTINWKSEGKTKVTFHEILGFQLQNGPGCEIGKEGEYVSKLHNANWKCSSGCTVNDVISDVNYYCSSANVQEQWEQGDKTFSFNFPSTGPFVVSYADPTNGHYIQTHVDLRARSDINEPNSSPVTTVKPVYRFPLGCQSTIKIPVSDPDGDTVKCRWANSVECGGTCHTLQAAVLDQDTCTLTVDTTTANGYNANQVYSVKITMEDQPNENILLDTQHYTINDTISSAPVQFTIHITQPTTSCTDRPVFVSDTPGDQAVVTSSTGVFDIDLYAKTFGSSTRIKEFVLSSPNGLTVSSPSIDDKGRLNIWHATMTWSPNSAQLGLSTVCIEAVDDTGMPSEQRCLFLKADKVNFCDPNPCLNNGVCTSYGNSYTCSCKTGYFGLNCESQISDTCTDPNDSYCICNINGKPAKIPFPEDEEEPVTTRDLISGIVGFPIGAVIGVALCSIWHHCLRKKCSADNKRKRLMSRGSSVSSSSKSLGSGTDDVESMSSTRDVNPVFPTKHRLK